VFPHVLQIGDILFGSNEAIPFAPETVRGRLEDRAFQAYFRRAGVEIGPLVERELEEREIRRWGPDHDRSTLTDVNTDLFPRDEYLVDERFWPGERGR
jgi:hypothetical protein